MLMNSDYLDFIKKYKRRETCDKDLVQFFRKIKPYLKLNNYSDPSKVLEVKDFEQIAFIGYVKSLEKYDVEKSDSALSWTYHIVHQTILRELKVVYKPDRILINSSMMRSSDPDNEDLELDFDNFCFCDGYAEAERNLGFHNMNGSIKKISKQLHEINPKANKIFQLKLAFPNLSRNSMALMLGFKRRNGLARLILTIKTVSYRVFPKEFTEGCKYDEVESFAELDQD